MRLVPRVYLDGNSFNFLQAIGSDFAKFKAAVGLVGRVVREKQLDGIVWDSPFNLF